MKLFFDTNVVVDVIQKRNPFWTDIIKIVDFAVKNEIMICISATSVTNIIYLTRKSVVDKEKILQLLTELFTIVDTSAKDILLAKDMKWKDFEDSVQYAIASREKADYLITRNKKDFETDDRLVVTPQDFISIIE